MSEPGRRRLPFTGPPSRQPGQGDVELEPVAGDMQLGSPALSNLRRAGRAKATEWERTHLFPPGARAPVSGVYDVVDDDGAYLEGQITCHEGTEFPVTQNKRARARDEQVEEANGRGVTRVRTVHHYGYRLAYEAVHLTPPVPKDEAIYLPGDLIPASGVYNVVDLNGMYLLHQRACVHNKVGDKAKRNRFPETGEMEPGTYGYRLEYEAEHLSS